MDYTLKHTYGRYAAYWNARSSPLGTSGKDASIPSAGRVLLFGRHLANSFIARYKYATNVSGAATRRTGASKLLEELVGDASGDFGAPA